jgi:hypothetical protein
MAINPITSYSSLPTEVIIRTFSETQSISELGKIGQVCKTWHHLHLDNRLWEPFLRDLDPRSYEIMWKDHQNFTSIKIKWVVQSFIQEHQATVDEIVGLIDDKALGSVLGDDSMTLEKMKAKSAPDRSLTVWRALGRDANPLYTHLVDETIAEVTLFIKTRQDVGKVVTSSELERFSVKEKRLPLLHVLIQKKQGPFDAEKIFRSLAVFSVAFSSVHQIYAAIVKAHHKMPDFFQLSSFDVEFAGVQQNIAMDLFVTGLKPVLGNYGVTEEDWAECGWPT